MEENVQKGAVFLKTKSNNPKIAIVLGSGLATLVPKVKNQVIINYSEIPGFLKSTAPNHKGELIFGTINNVPVVLLNGRFHYYEGYDLKDITRYLKILKSIGVKSILFTNASGSTTKTLQPGSLVAISDHINMSMINPLRGKNDDDFGPRFVNVTNCYNPQNIKLLESLAKKLNIPLAKSVYGYTLGPSFETAAEVKMFNTLGADIIGMSTVPEVIMARFCDLDITAISCVSNFGTGITGEDLTLEEVAETTNKYKDHFCDLVTSFIEAKYGAS